MSAQPTQDEVCDYLNAELSAIFPTSNVRAHIRNILGRNIHVRYMNAATVQDCSNGIAENDPAYMNFAIWGEDGAFYIEHPSMHRNVFKAVGIKRFVTMRGTEMECAQKLVAFMRKHAESFVALGLR